MFKFDKIQKIINDFTFDKDSKNFNNIEKTVEILKPLIEIDDSGETFVNIECAIDNALFFNNDILIWSEESEIREKALKNLCLLRHKGRG